MLLHYAVSPFLRGVLFKLLLRRVLAPSNELWKSPSLRPWVFGVVLRVTLFPLVWPLRYLLPAIAALPLGLPDIQV